MDEYFYNNESKWHDRYKNDCETKCLYDLNDGSKGYSENYVTLNGLNGIFQDQQCASTLNVCHTNHWFVYNS